MGRCGNALEIKNLCLSGLSEKMSLPYLQTAVETKEGGRKKTVSNRENSGYIDYFKIRVNI